MYLFGLKLTILSCLLVLVQTDAPAWFNGQQQPTSERLGQSSIEEPRGANPCFLPTILLPGPAPLASLWAWKWTCYEHGDGPSPVYLGQPQKVPTLDHPTFLGWEQGLQASTSPKPSTRELARMVLGASLAVQEENWDLVRRCLDFLAIKGWPLPAALQDQAPIVEWLALRYELACTQLPAYAKRVAEDNRDYSSHFKVHSTTLPPSEGRLVWDHALAMGRYRWSRVQGRPSDALAYFREAQHLHSTLHTDWMTERQITKAAVRRTGMPFWDYRFGLGVLVLFLAGTWYRTGLHSPVVEVYDRLQGMDGPEGWQHPMPSPETLSALRTQLIHTNEAWESFKIEFEQHCPGFIAWVLNLGPGMTQGELRTACMIRLGLTSREIARVQNIGVYGVAQSRYRLRKRLGLPTRLSIEEVLFHRGGDVAKENELG